VSAHLGHPDPLILPTLAAHTPMDIGGVSSVLEVVPTGCRQGGLQLVGPFLVGLGEPPDLIGGQAQIRSAVRNG
jgi:hypothetical protein